MTQQQTNNPADDLYLNKDGVLMDKRTGKPAEKVLTILHADMSNTDLVHALKSAIAYAFQPIIVPVMILLSWALQRKVTFLTVKKVLVPGRDYAVPPSMREQTAEKEKNTTQGAKEVTPPEATPSV